MINLSEEIVKTSYEEREPYVRLIGAIIKQAIVDKDYNFFFSKLFKRYCNLVDLSPSYIRRMAEIEKWRKK